MLLRKRTSFKPNLNQVAVPKNTSQQNIAQPNGSIPTPIELNSTGQEAAPNKPIRDSQSPTRSYPSEALKHGELNELITVTNQRSTEDQTDVNISNLSPVKRPLEDESSRRVHEAITQLTGQKFEPIKSISLRNSVNKDVKLRDLLFFNPPLTKDQKRHKKSIHLAKKNERMRLSEGKEPKSRATNDIDDNTLEIETEDSNVPMKDDAEEPSLVPKVKLGPEGQLILDESSTVINRKNSIKAQEAIIEDNEEIISRTNYDSYRRKPTSTNQTKWSTDDTQKFYQALTILGTDFSMMESLLFSGHRSRTELHKKFKREERINKTKIDIALTNRITLNSEELDGLKDMFYK